MTSRTWMVALALLGLLGACTDRTTELASDPVSQVARDAAPDAMRPKDATTMRVDTSTPPSPPAADCGGHACGCSNGLDDDGDLLIDGFDPECTGPFDDDESSFGTGGPVSTEACLDCFFDRNTTADDDGCSYPRVCLTGEMAPNDEPSECGGCNVTGACIQACRNLAPNGCDCFGCCEVARSDGSSIAVQAVPGCSVALVEDESACPRCEPASNCRNRCGRCELCPGRTSADLPSDCKLDAGDPSVPGHVCDDGEAVCSDQQPCDFDHYCQSGCCLIRVL